MSRPSSEESERLKRAIGEVRVEPIPLIPAEGDTLKLGGGLHRLRAMFDIDPLKIRFKIIGELQEVKTE